MCYDTGGVNLKTANSMKTMKHDMAGSAAALAAFMVLAEDDDIGELKYVQFFLNIYNVCRYVGMYVCM